MNDSGPGASSHDLPTPATQPTAPTPPPAAPGAGRPAGLALAWRAPLIGYGVLLAASLVLGVLLIVALSSGDAPSEVGDVSDATDGVLAWLAIPFQLAAMALGGRLGLGGDGFSVSVMVLPLLLTATYVVVVARVAGAAEARVPARTRQERALLSGAGAVGAALVVAVLTRLLALRADGESVHALSVSLVVGTLLLTSCADLAGRELRTSGVPAVLLRWWPAAASWLAGVAVWLVVSLPVLFVVVWVQEGFRVALSIPLWWPTTGLWTYALGHLSGVGTSGYYSYAWSGDGVLAPLALLLGAVLVTLVAAVVWRLRAPRTDAELATPQSWAPLPVAFAIGGVLVTLVPMVSVGGGAFGVSGSLTAMPAAWTCVLLALWGLGAEALSRTVAPRLVPVLPGVVVARLRGPAAVSGVDAPAPEPLTPEQARKVRRTAIIVGSGLGAVVLAVVAVSVIGSMFFSPENAAEDYLDALADGDVETVAALTSDDGDLSLALLSAEVAKATEGRPTSYTVEDVTTLGDSTMVEVSADDGVGGDGYLTLEKAGRTLGLFQDWEVTEGLTSTLSVPTQSATLTVNGVEVETPDDGFGTFAVLPGTYTVDPYGGSEWIAGEPAEVDVALGDYASADLASPGPSDAFVSEVDAQVGAWLDECLASDETDPDGCPQTLYAYGDVRDLTWELTEEPTIDYDSFYGDFPTSFYASGGSAMATYEADESYGFGPKDWRAQQDESSLDFSVDVDLDGDDLVVTPEAY